MFGLVISAVIVLIMYKFFSARGRVLHNQVDNGGDMTTKYALIIQDIVKDEEYPGKILEVGSDYVIMLCQQQITLFTYSIEEKLDKVIVEIVHNEIRYQSANYEELKRTLNFSKLASNKDIISEIHLIRTQMLEEHLQKDAKKF